MEPGGLWMSSDESEALVAAIARAEKDNRGEVRVHLEKRCRGDAVERARALYVELGMNRTEGDTGVLLYVSPGSRKAAVWAGAGIHGAAHQDFWQSVTARVAEAFGAGEGPRGIVAAVDEVGEILRAHVPGADTAGNELPNKVTTS